MHQNPKESLTSVRESLPPKLQPFLHSEIYHTVCIFIAFLTRSQRYRETVTREKIHRRAIVGQTAPGAQVPLGAEFTASVPSKFHLLY